MSDLSIAYLAVGAVKPRPGNPRQHSRRQIKQLARSMREFGFVNPVLVDEELVLVAGHGRLEAAIAAGLHQVPVIQIPGLSGAQKRALMVADNRLAESSAWDSELLANTLSELIEFDYDVELTGFDTGDIDKLLRFSDVNETDNDDDLDPVDREIPAVSRLGDTWSLGDHRLHCGDALSAASYEAVLGEQRAQMVFADPPYNVRIQGHASGLGEARHPEFAMASGEMSEAEFTAFLAAAARLLVRFSEDGSLHFICMDWRHQFELLTAVRPVYSEQKNLCVWTKDNAGMGSLYRSRHELVSVFKNGDAPHCNNVELGRRGRHRTNVWTYAGGSSFGRDRADDLEAHPTVKPVALVADAILDCSRINGLILDPFGGAGTTILACARTKRRAAVIEIDPHYVDVTIRRYEKKTKVKAVHIGTGLTFEVLRHARISEAREHAA